MRVLVTGGTGSFGHTAVERFLKRPDIEKVTVFSRDEKKQHDMRHAFKMMIGLRSWWEMYATGMHSGIS